MPIILIPFAVFFACCLAQFFFLRRVRQALAARHPDVWRAMSEKSWFIDNAVYKFAWRRRDRGLNDPDLTARVKQLRLLYFVAICVWAIYALALFSGVGLQQL